MKKKIFGLALALALALQMMPAVSAAEDPLDLAREKILACYATGEESVDIRQYSLEATQLEKLHNELYYANQLPWYADSYQYSYEEDSGKVLTFTPVLLKETEYDRNLYERKVAEILAETVHPGMTQLQIALSIHDYLAVNFQYDETKTYYEGYDLLVRGTAVCNGYAEAYMDLLKRSGVECHYVVSEKMDHGWNQVKLGDHWYHVDVTWDDPVEDWQGNADHTYFLLSDEAIGSLEEAHYDYEALHESQDKTYDRTDFWDNTVSPVCFESADTCYYVKADDENQYICRRNGSGEQILHRFEQGVVSGDKIYRYATYGLSMTADRLYFCDGEKISSIKKDGADLRVEHQETFSPTHGIFGAHLAGDTLKITTWDLNDTFTLKTVKAENVTVHTHTYEQSRYEGACEEKGGSAYSCACGVTYKVEDTTARGHDYELVNEQARGLFENGWETWECRNCDHSYTDTRYAIISKDFLTDKDTLKWIISGVVILLVIIGKARKKK